MQNLTEFDTIASCVWQNMIPVGFLPDGEGASLQPDSSATFPLIFNKNIAKI